MYRMRFIPLIVIAWLSTFPALPQNKPILFDRLTSEDGLSQGHVLCLMQDSEGFIWAGTYNGLNRYNGYGFDVFYAENNKPGTLCIDVVYSLFEDRDGNIWCGTWGVDIFDKKTEKFRHIPALAGENTISAGEVSAIKQDSLGNIWLATQGGGLNKYDPASGKISYFQADEKSSHSIKSNFLNDLLIDGNTLWIATTEGGLSRMDLDDESIVTYQHIEGDPHSLPSNKISCLYKDREGNIWLGDQSGALARYNNEQNNFIRYYYLTHTFASEKAPLMQIAQDKDGNLLLATNGSGLVVFNYKTGLSHVFLFSRSNLRSIIFNENASILVDKTNTIFIGSYGRGISKYSPYSNKFNVVSIPNETIQSDNINSFTDGIEDYSGHFITGTYDGFLVFDKKTWTYTHYRPGTIYEDNKILTVEVAPDSTLWLSSMRSLHRYDKNFKKLNSYVFDPSLKDHSIYSIEFDDEDNLWVALFTKGLLKIPPSEWRNKKKKELDYKLYLLDNNDPNSISGNQQWIILQDDSSNLWFGGVGGLDRYNPLTDNFDRIIYPGSVKALTFDSKGTAWMSIIGEGICSYNFNSKHIDRYTVKDGLSHSFIYGIVVDRQDNLWINTESGLSRFYPDTKKFRVYDKSDGLPSNHFDDKSETLLSDGRIYMGTNEGFILFYPEDIVDDTSQVNIVLTSIGFDNRDYTFYVNQEGDTIPLGMVKKIDITPSQRDIKLGFTAMHFASPQKIQYRYKLEGYDRDWIETEADHREAKYTNLNGGSYTFIVKATNSDGKWMNKPLKIQLVVHPPFFKTILFRILILVIISVLIVLFYRWRISLEVKQKQRLKKLVEERTSEITKKNILLETKAEELRESNTMLEERQQFILAQSEELTMQRDELAQLNATKDKLFSIIAHDLKNPFNALMGYSELMIAHMKDWNEDKMLYFLNLLKDTSENAYSLLENLLEWSRSQSGVIQFQPVSKQVFEICAMVLPDIEGIAQKKGIQIIDNTKQNKTCIEADLNMITVVLRNLITNAIKFSNKGHQVTIDAVNIEADTIRFSVRDEGIGMNEQTLAGLFQLTKSHPSTGTEGEKGTGLGLILCKDFIKFHGGQL